MNIVNEEIITYLHQLQPFFDGALGEIQRDALAQGIPIVDPETARLLATLLSIVRPKAVLEIGCAVGFSAALMSRYAGHVTTIDRFEIMIQQARDNFKKLQVEEKVTLLEGDATAVLKQLSPPFDFILLDAAKGQYLGMLPDCLRLLPVGGVLFVDDVFQNGNIIKDRFEVERRQRTIHSRMQVFLHCISHTDGLETSIVPIADGVAIIHKTKENIVLGMKK